MAGARSGYSALVLVALLLIGGCSPVVIEAGPTLKAPQLMPDAIVTADGYRLPLRSWQPAEGEPKAIVLALHGFNDYSNFFDEPATILSQFGIRSYAFDQRGFGATSQTGYWHGAEQMARDARLVFQLIKDKHPDLPLFALGSSMGGATTISAVTLDDGNRPDLAGIILVAPAVWGRATMPWYQTGALWLAAHTTPWMELTGRGLDIKPSDNYDMLVALGRDPLIIKRTRVDAIWGLVNLMDRALAQGAALKGPVLMLYGDRDDIVPRKPTYKMIDRMAAAGRADVTLGFYQMGYHMLLRDLAAPTVLKDIAAWIANPSRPLPSGADAWAAVQRQNGKAAAAQALVLD